MVWMARRRIKTLAAEWGVSVEEALAGCARLKLGHAPSESSLLTPEEAEKLKADLDEQAHRAEVLRRETVLETSGGKIVEKRLNATVMRRRHAETGAPATSAEPFHFEVEQKPAEPFAAPFLGESQPEPDIPAFAETPPPPLPEPEVAPAEMVAAPEPALKPEPVVEEQPPVEVPEPSVEAKYADAAALGAQGSAP